MRRLAVVALTLVLGGCSSSGGALDESSPTYGCNLAEKGFVAYDDSVSGATNATATPEDLAKLLATVKERMEGVSLIANGELKTHAAAAALAAGRVRVALNGGSADAKAEAGRLRTAMLAASAICNPK